MGDRSLIDQTSIAGLEERRCWWVDTQKSGGLLERFCWSCHGLLFISFLYHDLRQIVFDITDHGAYWHWRLLWRCKERRLLLTLSAKYKYLNRGS